MIGGGTVADAGETTKQADGDDGSATQPGEKWGDPISEARQAELRALFQRQKAWVAQRKATRGESVFKGVHLTGADVFWLAEASGDDWAEWVPNLHLEGADLREAHLAGAVLTGAHLEGVALDRAQLAGADFSLARLAGAHLCRAQLAGADLDLAQLERADLTSATFDKTSHLNGAVLTGVSLDQVTYDGVNLTVLDWSLVPVLGDELTARRGKGAGGKRKDRTQRLAQFTAAVRANRVLAVTLRSQGLNEDADRYAYRAQLLQRSLLRLRGRWGSALGSWLLDLVAGYGYRPIRSVFTYVFVVVAFAAAYFILGGTHGALSWNEALVVSMTAFHGRGFFGSAFQPGDPQAAVAAVEALIGLLIEITFIATFTNRFFAR